MAKPVEHKISSIATFIDIVRQYPPDGWMYRGQSRDWPLLPKAGRPEFFIPANAVFAKRGQSSNDLGRFSEWRHQSVAYFNELPSNDFECLALAQHYGLATRLLDWSSNPLVALFFAAESDPELDGFVYCFLGFHIIDAEKADMFTIDRVAALIPRPIDRRVMSQRGQFTFHPRPEKPLTASPVDSDIRLIAPDGVDLVRIRVPSTIKHGLQRHLRDLGVNRRSLFPDLEGLSADVNWSTMSIVRGRAMRKAKSEGHTTRAHGSAGETAYE